MCGRLHALESYPDIKTKVEEARQREKEGEPLKLPVFICDRCSGKLKYEADKEQKGTRPI